MPDKDYVVLTIRVTPEERQRIKELARRRGYNAPSDYLRALVESDAKTPDGSFELEDEIDPIEDFRQGWHEAMTGNIRPISELWDALDEDD